MRDQTIDKTIEILDIRAIFFAKEYVIHSFKNKHTS